MLKDLSLNLKDFELDNGFKMYLAKPNKQIIKNIGISNVLNANLKGIELNGLAELEFEITHEYTKKDYKTGEVFLVRNSDTNDIREEMLIKLSWFNKKRVNWFRVSKIHKSDSNDITTMTVTAEALPSELRKSEITTEMDSVDVNEYFEHVLEQSAWKLGTVSSKLKDTYRSFDENKRSKYEAIMDGAETYGAILDWDEDKRTLNLKSIDEVKVFRGVTLKRENFAESIELETDTDDIVTRLYAYGNEKLGIEKANPTGMAYVEDFSYFMNPFKRDENKNVLSHSYYMSDELCHALLDLEVLQKEYNPKIKQLQELINNAYKDLSTKSMSLVELEGQLISLQALLDTAKATNDEDLIYQRTMEVRDKQSEIDKTKKDIENIQESIDTWELTIKSHQQLISTNSFTKELVDELSLFVYEKEFSDDRYIDDKELYEATLEQFEKYHKPIQTFNVDLMSFVNSIESQEFNNKLHIGEEVVIKSTDFDFSYKSIVLGYDVDLIEGDYNVIISDSLDDVNSLDKLATLIYKADSSSTVLSNNKYKWDSVAEVTNEVKEWRENAINSTNNRIIAGANESMTIDNRGLIARNPDFPNEMLIMQSGVLALSKDGGETWATSVTPDGVVAERIIGKILAGENLLITNEQGSFVIDSKGLTIDMDSINIMSGKDGNRENLIQSWNNLLLTFDEIANDNLVNEYEKNQLDKQWTKMKNIHSSMLETFNSNWKPENVGDPKPKEYEEYVRAYEAVNKYLNTTKQSDGFTLLDKSNRKNTTKIVPEDFVKVFNDYDVAKQKFEPIIPIEFSKSEIRALEEGISLTYTKNDEIVANLNLYEGGVKIDGKLLEINAETEFNKDLTMNAGVIKGKDNGIVIDLNEGTVELNKPIVIGKGSNLVTKDDINKLELEAYSLVLTNDQAMVPTDPNGENGDFTLATTQAVVYKGAKDDTVNWKITSETTTGVTGTLVGNEFKVTKMTRDSGTVILKATQGTTTLTKGFRITKVKAGAHGDSGESAKILSLESEGYVMTFNADGTPNPAKQSLKVKAQLQNTVGNVSWIVNRYNGNTFQSAITKTATENSITINESDFIKDTTSIRILAKLGNLTDTVTIVKVSSGKDGDKGNDGIAGKDGVGVKSTIITYGLSDNESTQPSSWTNNVPNLLKGKYLWTKTVWEYTDNTTETGYIKTYIAKDGNTGKDGIAGKDGIGIKSTTITYTSSTSGTVQPTSNWTSTIPSVPSGRYLWTKTVWTYTDNTSETGYSVAKIGEDGKDGSDGDSIKEVINYYLATSQSTGVTTGTSGWTTTIQNMSKDKPYLWNYEVSKSVSGKVISTTTPVIIGYHAKDGQSGKDGVSITSIVEYYQVSNSNTVAPTTWSKTVPQLTEQNKYLWNYEEINYSNQTKDETAKKVIGVYGDTGQAGKDAIVGVLTNESITVSADSNGNVSDLSNANGVFKVFEGIQDKTSSAKFSIVSQNKVVATIDTSGNYKLTAVSTGTTVLSGSAVLRAVYGGVTIDKTLSVAKSLAGSSGSSATSYWLTSNANIIKATSTGVHSPDSIKFSSRAKTGSNSPIDYSGRYIIETSEDGNKWTEVYKSTSNETSASYSTKTEDKFVKAKLYQAGSTNILLDEQTIPVLLSSDDVQVGGRNLIEGTKSTPQKGKYNIGTYNDLLHGRRKLSDYGIKAGDILTTSMILNVPSHAGIRARIEFYEREDHRTNRVGNVISGGTGKSIVTTVVPEGFSEFRIMTQSDPSPSDFVADYEYSKVKLEFGNVATDWTPAIEDLNQQIEDIQIGGRNLSKNSANFKTISPDIKFYTGDNNSLKLDNGTIIGKATSSQDRLFLGSDIPIDGKEYVTTSGYIELKSSDTVKELGIGGKYFGRNSNNSTEESGSIDREVAKLKHIKDDLYYFSGTIKLDDSNGDRINYRIYIYPTKGTETEFRLIKFKNEIGTKATDWSPAPEDVYEKIDSIEIGGTNLLRDTKDFSDNWVKMGSSTHKDDIEKGFKYVEVLDTWKNYIYQGIPLLEQNVVYSLSFYAKAPRKANLEIKDDGINNFVVDTVEIDGVDWKRYSVLFSQPKDITKTKLAFFTRQAETPIAIKKIKLEKGNKPSDWSPAPEDVYDEINNIQVGGRNLFSYSKVRTDTGWSWNYTNKISSEGSWASEIITNEDLNKMGLVEGQEYLISYKFILEEDTDKLIPYNQSAHGTLLLFSGVDHSIYPNIELGGTEDNVERAKKWKKGTVVEVKDKFVVPNDISEKSKYRILAYTYRAMNSNNVFVKNLKGSFFDIKIEEGTRHTTWTPSLDDSTIFRAWANDLSDLDAIVTTIEPKENFLINGTFSKTVTGTAGKNKGIYATHWSGYNGGIANPSTNYHAYVNETAFPQFNVLEYNESDGTRHWKGINQILVEQLPYIKNSKSDLYISMDVRATMLGEKNFIYGGMYYKNKAGVTTFHDGHFRITPTEANKWQRLMAKVPFDRSDVVWDSISFYIYAYNFSNNAIIYIKDVSLSLDENELFLESRFEPDKTSYEQVPKFVGISGSKGTRVRDYTWSVSPEYLQARTDAGLDEKADSSDLDEVRDTANNANNLAENSVQKEEFYSWLEQDYENQVADMKSVSDRNQRDLASLTERTAIVEGNYGDMAVKWNFIDQAITFGNEGMMISNKDSKMAIQISSDKIVFWDNNVDVAFVTGEMLKINRGVFLKSATIGNHIITTYSDKSPVTIIRYVGDVI